MRFLTLKNPLKTVFPVPPADSKPSILPPVGRVGFSPSRFPHVKPRLVVKEKSRVEPGTPMFYDKRHPDFQFLSPVSGQVEEIRFGHRRSIDQIVIRPDDFNERRVFDTQPADTPASTTRKQFVDSLIKRGFWFFFRQFPFNDIPARDRNFPFIIISLQTNDPFAPLPAVIFSDPEAGEDFIFGLDLLKSLAQKIILACPESQIHALGKIRDRVTFLTDDRYPASDPWVILYQIKSTPLHHDALTLDPQDLVAIGHCYRTGCYKLDKYYRVINNLEKSDAHFLSAVGSPVDRLLNGRDSAGAAVFAGGVFTGRRLESDAFMGQSESSVVLINQDCPEQLFGFIHPGYTRFSESNAFFSRLAGKARFPMDATLHGEERPCINCGYCQKKCPVDLFPQFVMKAFLAGDMEEAVRLGLPDCTGCGMCSVVCPSNIELTSILDQAKNQYFRESVG